MKHAVASETDLIFQKKMFYDFNDNDLKKTQKAWVNHS